MKLTLSSFTTLINKFLPKKNPSIHNSSFSSLTNLSNRSSAGSSLVSINSLNHNNPSIVSISNIDDFVNISTDNLQTLNNVTKKQNVRNEKCKKHILQELHRIYKNEDYISVHNFTSKLSTEDFNLLYAYIYSHKSETNVTKIELREIIAFTYITNTELDVSRHIKAKLTEKIKSSFTSLHQEVKQLDDANRTYGSRSNPQYVVGYSKNLQILKTQFANQSNSLEDYAKLHKKLSLINHNINFALSLEEGGLSNSIYSNQIALAKQQSK